MEPIPPFWFAQRQGKVEAAGADTYRLTAPNAPPAFISIRHSEDGRWSAALRFEPEGPDAAVSEQGYETVPDAWNAAFELYRVHVVV
jgi:hypothetical protein